MEQRISLVTLGVSDLARSTAFYARLGWHGQEVEETVFLHLGGLALVLWDREKGSSDLGSAADVAEYDSETAVLQAKHGVLRRRGVYLGR